jgi:hypothetical protein
MLFGDIHTVQRSMFRVQSYSKKQITDTGQAINSLS